jgi:type I restriction enzyme S subunit
MAANWPKIPAFDSVDDVDISLPIGWSVHQIEYLYDQLPIGKRFDQKSSAANGTVPVIDQSADGIIGWHDEQPSVVASEMTPVITFANHTCEMRLMRRPFSVIQNVFPLVGKNGICDTCFLYYGTKGRVHLEEYKGHYPDFRRKWILVPPLPEQHAIAHILGALDDKIELNRKMNETLEAMARAIFKSWFVDFDPVRAKADGRKPFGMNEETAALFPDSFVDSELGEIPKGWEVAPFRTVLKPRVERVQDANLPEYSATVDGLVPRSSYFKKQLSKSQSNNKRIISGDLVFGLSRRVINFGLMCDPIGAVSPVYEVFGVATDRFAPELLEKSFRVNMEFHLNILRPGAREGQPIDREFLLSKDTVIPDRRVQDAFISVTDTYNKRIRVALCESLTLAALRDTLLPKLLSGEIRIKEAEIVVASVT